MAEEKKPETQGQAATGQAAGQVKVRWDTSNIKSSYSNVCNVTSTREEVVLNFGINQSWERNPGDLEIQLTNRIILSPFAAKRLSMVLGRLMAEHESRYGDLRLEAGPDAPGGLKQ